LPRVGQLVYAEAVAAPQVTYASASLEDLPVVRELFREYERDIGVDLSFQGFSGELASLPGKYSEPAGALIVAWDGTAACGCIALRPIDDGICEMKRLYVRAAYRRLGVGRELVTRIMDSARQKGYTRIRLDTLPSMANAIRLYREIGFREIEPYVYNPIPGTHFMEKLL
jgi:ribosomal protein S18 acetylase RimI-like enzyme